MEKKIRVTLPKNIIKILELDCETFKITKNYLLNYIFDFHYIIIEDTFVKLLNYLNVNFQIYI